MKPKLKRLLTKAIFICVFLVIFLFFVAYRMMTRITGRIVYSEQKKEIIETGRVQLGRHGAQPVSFVTEDGLRIAGLLIVRSGATRNLVVCHGYRQAKEFYWPLADMFDGDNILFFDFRAHGDSEGKRITIGHREKSDVQAAVAFLRENEKTKGLPTCGLGVSMGAVALIAAAAEGTKFQALLLDSPFANLGDHIAESFTLRTGLPRFPLMNLCVFLFEMVTGISVADNVPCEQMCQVECSVFLVHSKDDYVTHVDHSLALYEQKKEDTDLWLIEKARHGRAYIECRDEYALRARGFLDQVTV